MLYLPWMGWIPVYAFLSVVLMFVQAWLRTKPEYFVLERSVLVIRIILGLACVYEFVRIHRKKKLSRKKGIKRN